MDLYTALWVIPAALAGMIAILWLFGVWLRCAPNSLLGWIFFGRLWLDCGELLLTAFVYCVAALFESLGAILSGGE